MESLSTQVNLKAERGIKEQAAVVATNSLGSSATAKYQIQQPTAPSVAPSPYQTTPPRKRRKQQLENITTGRWSKQEHELFLRGLETFGKEWKSIASLIPTRTVVQIRTHAQKYFQKMKKRKARGESIDSVTSIRAVEQSGCVKTTQPEVRKTSVEQPTTIKFKGKTKIRSKRSPPKRPILKKARKKLKNPSAASMATRQIYSASTAEPSPTSQVDLTFHFPASQNCSESVASLFPTIFPTGVEFDGLFGVSSLVEHHDSSQEQLVLEALPCEQEEFIDLGVVSMTNPHPLSLF